MATIGDLSNELTTPATGDKLLVRDISAAAGSQDKFVTLGGLGITGTWTPVVRDASSGGNTGTGTINGGYYRLGPLVFAWGNLVNINTSGMTAGNQVYITGFPYAVRNATGYTAVCKDIVHASVTFSQQIEGRMAATTTYMQLHEPVSASAPAIITVSDLVSGQADITFAVVYLTD